MVSSMSLLTMVSVKMSNVPDGFIDVVVDDGEVEEVAEGLLQAVTLLGQPLQRAVVVL